MQVNEVPEPWATAMLAKDFEHGKRPSIRALARAAGIGSAETVRQMIYGTRVPDPETVERVASALGRSPVEISRWVHQERTTRRPYVVPPEVALLTEAEQDALNGMILAIARGRRPRNEPKQPRRLQVIEVWDGDSMAEYKEAAMEPRPGDTPPGQSEEPDT